MALILEVHFEVVSAQSVAQGLIRPAIEGLVARHPWTPALLQLNEPLVLTFVGCGVVGREVAAGGQVAVGLRCLHGPVRLRRSLWLRDLLALLHGWRLALCYKAQGPGLASGEIHGSAFSLALKLHLELRLAEHVSERLISGSMELLLLAQTPPVHPTTRQALHPNP